MDIGSTLINVFVVVAMGSLLAYMTRELRREVKEDFARLESRMDAWFNSIRSDLTAVALAVGAEAPRPSPQAGSP